MTPAERSLLMFLVLEKLEEVGNDDWISPQTRGSRRQKLNELIDQLREETLERERAELTR